MTQVVDRPSEEVEERDLSFFHILMVLAENNRRIVAVVLAVSVVTAIVSLLLPQRFASTARLMPPKQSYSAASALMGASDLMDKLGNANASLVFEDPNDIYLQVLQSRSVRKALIDRFKLMERYKNDNMTDTYEDVKDRTTLVSEAGHTIKISFEDKDPRMAVEITGAYIEEFRNALQRVEASDAISRAKYFEEQIETVRANLEKAELELRKVQERTGLLGTVGQPDIIVKSIADMKALIIMREAELASLQSAATDQNPDLIRKRNELATLRSQLAKVQGRNTGTSGDVQVPAGMLPAAAVEYVRKLRTVREQEEMLMAMTKQYEAAKLDQTKSAAVVQVLDEPNVPERRSFPKRKMMVLIAMIVSFVLSCAYFVGVDAVRVRMETQPDSAARWAMMKAYLRGHRAR